MPLAETKQIDIGVIGNEDARVWVNELDLTTVVKNLVDNAIRYTPAGGKVDLSVTAARDRTTLKIQDSGPGIQIAERKRVFDPFYRPPGSEQAGSGLGLSIVKVILERMGAEIQLSYSDEANCSGLSVCISIPYIEKAI